MNIFSLEILITNDFLNLIVYLKSWWFSYLKELYKNNIIISKSLDIFFDYILYL